MLPAHRRALWACRQLRCAPGIPRCLPGPFRALVRRQGPDDRFIDVTVLEYRAGMVNHQAVGLARRRPEPAADHLPVEHDRPRRPRQDDAADVRHVHTLADDAAVRHDVEGP